MTDRQLSYHYRIEWAWGGWVVRWYYGESPVVGYGPYRWRATAEAVAREGPTR